MVQKPQSKPTPVPVRCADHQYAPAIITCIHIFNRTTSQCVAVPQPDGTETEGDWLCPSCFREHLVEGIEGVDNLRTACLHCARELIAGLEIVPWQEV